MNRISRPIRARSAEQDSAFLITDARPGASVDEHSRIVKYSISMGVRVLCFVLAFFVHGWLQILCLVAAVVLPYFAVIIANGRPSVGPEERNARFMDELPEEDDDAAAHEILVGEVVPPSEESRQDKA
ncbi:DUF3099 domain-containing protein [Neomicrococcus lactis]|uniref:Flp pilus assembly protein TadB n=1 Tax=Neomicrococcus lactis TaxID=732241 RepID=A0A7W9DAN0_9MICC|nr:DUF3099 domain-containing protein [Neomicrococcus lactis]MBB5597830.1 Flp pilus assembly protein TadB [Neomicrococcus lactis]